uniref:PPFIA binding protein 2a n=1 Tax=Cyprinus carpio TaxID=7962 RepID=A0A8C2EBC5_CYPCA
MTSDVSFMLEAALEQMDDIIAEVHTFPVCPAHLRVLQLAEELKFSLEGQICAEDKDTLRRQMPSATAQSLLLWLDKRSEISVNVQGSGNGESYQERLSRLEGDKESLVLQVGVLTDQVEAQGEKIRHLENSLESQKLGLMEEVSCLKLKLGNMEEKHIKSAERQHKAENLLQELKMLKHRIEELEQEKMQYEQKLKVTQVLQHKCDCESQRHTFCPKVVVHIFQSNSCCDQLMKRTGVLSDDIEPTQFKRGGFRATAGPRLTRTPDSGSASRAYTPFSMWTTEQVCGWLEDTGMGQYVSLARQWVDSGQTLLSATPQELEKEICIKHPLHRKKLQLALRAFSNKTMEKSSELDHIWVTRWLDDVGLPQYKDQFYESKVDGRMLQYLTVNDLLFLKVTSQLHHLSIKCAIHVLHVNKFNPNCLRRRPGDENKTSPSEVVQWSNHRVMEWLRSVDLAEYAPNLRGSGVHGGLIILEPRFQSETLAMLLNIPPQKTLLRRHLATNFNSLVGPQAQQEKQEFANASGHAPLTTTAKVRPKKLGFTHFRQLRKLRVDESADYICPMDTGTPPALTGTPQGTYGSFRGISPNLARDSDRLENAGSKN